jgi:hypothetical protein
MQGYPFGTFLFWKVEAASSNKFKFYDFVLNYHQRDAAHCPELGALFQQSVTAVLDGQQRLTALKPSEVAAQNQPQNGCRLRIQAGLDLEKRAVAVLNSHEDVKAGFIIEVAE